MKSDLTALAPANGSNAIVTAAFAIELDNPAPDPRAVAAFAALAPQMQADGYEPPLSQQFFTMSFAPNFAGAPAPMQEVGGYAYVKKTSAGLPLREFALRGNSISVVIHEYTRWQTIWTEVHKLFNICGPLLADSSRVIRSVALQYIDKFTWRKPNEPFPVKDVLVNGSPYVAADALEQTGAWHNQYGRQMDLPGHPWAAYRLDNVNVNVALEGGFNALTVFTLFRYFGRVAAKEAPDFVSKSVPDLFSEAHSDNKALMRSLLTDHVCKMISLNADSPKS